METFLPKAGMSHTYLNKPVLQIHPYPLKGSPGLWRPTCRYRWLRSCLPPPDILVHLLLMTSYLPCMYHICKMDPCLRSNGICSDLGVFCQTNDGLSASTLQTSGVKSLVPNKIGNGICKPCSMPPGQSNRI